MNKKNIGIPVLMYHHVNPEGNFINVTPRNFEAQMGYLHRHGFTTLHTGEMLSILLGHTALPKKPVMITFDDGWLDNWVYAFPTMKKYGIKATIFVITSFIPENGRRKRADEGDVPVLPEHRACQQLVDDGNTSEVIISWEEIREMADSGLIEIQSHTHTHRRYDKLYPDREERNDVLKQELKTSKEIIEKKLDMSCEAICWPWGKYHKEYVEAAYSLGYRMMFTTEKGTNTYETEPWRIKRITIGDIGVFTFWKKLLIYSHAHLSRAYLNIFKR